MWHGMDETVSIDPKIVLCSAVCWDGGRREKNEATHTLIPKVRVAASDHRSWLGLLPCFSLAGSWTDTTVSGGKR